MYTVEIMTRQDYERGKKYPVNMPAIRNISITQGRYLLVDDADHMITFRPDEVMSFSVWKNKEGI